MTAPFETTAENLRELRESRNLSQDQIASVLGLKGYHISNIEKKKRDLSRSEAALLNLYFFERMPFEIVGEKLLHSVLEFTEDQWKVICILAGRQGLTPGTWIANQIRAYLSMDDESRQIRENLEAQRRASNAGLIYLQELSDVAEDPPSEQTGTDDSKP